MNGGGGGRSIIYRRLPPLPKLSANYWTRKSSRGQACESPATTLCWRHCRDVFQTVSVPRTWYLTGTSFPSSFAKGSLCLASLWSWAVLVAATLTLTRAAWSQVITATRCLATWLVLRSIPLPLYIRHLWNVCRRIHTPSASSDQIILTDWKLLVQIWPSLSNMTRGNFSFLCPDGFWNVLWDVHVDWVHFLTKWF